MKQTADVTSIKTINHTDSEKKRKRNAQNFEKLQNYKKNITNVATGTN